MLVLPRPANPAAGGEPVREVDGRRGGLQRRDGAAAAMRRRGKGSDGRYVHMRGCRAHGCGVLDDG